MNLLSSADAWDFLVGDFAKEYGLEFWDARLSWRRRFQLVMILMREPGTRLGAFYAGYSEPFTLNDFYTASIGDILISVNNDSKKGKPKPLPKPLDGAQVRKNFRMNLVITGEEEKQAERENVIDLHAFVAAKRKAYTEQNKPPDD